VHLGGGAQQEVGQRRMQRIARDEVGGRREQHLVAIGDVGGEVEDAVRKDELRKIREAADVGVGAGGTHQPDPGSGGQFLDRRRFGRRDEEGGVDGAFVELLDGRLALEGQQSRRRFVGAARTQQRQRERARTALRPAHGDAAALQVADVVERIAPVEYPEGNVRDAAQRDDMRGALAGVGPTLDQGHVHTGVFVRKQLDVGHRPAGLPHVEGDPVALEDLLVAPRVVSRAALFGSDGDGELLRRSRLDEQHGDPERRRDDQRGRRERHQ